MKKLALIALIMGLVLSGCASSCKNCFIIQDWVQFWKNPGAGNEEQIKQDWIEFWHDPCK